MSENPARAASLDYLEVEFHEPLADEVVGEIFPTAVLPGEATEFSYFMLPRRTSGFDQLMMAASAPMQFREVLVGENPDGGGGRGNRRRDFRSSFRARSGSGS